MQSEPAEIQSERDGRSHSRHPSALIERGAFGALVAFIFLACIPHGLVAPAGRFGLQWFSFGLAVIVALTARNRVSGPARRLIGCLALLAGIGFVQILPLPPSVVEAISPASARMYHESSTVLKSSGRNPVDPRISIAPRRTASTALGLLAFAALVFAAASLTRNPLRRRILAVAVLMGAMLQVLHVVVTGQSGRVHGTFVVSNNFAAFLAIAFATAAAYSLGERRRSLRLTAFFVVSLLIVGMTLVRTGSTGGLAAAIYGTALLFLLERAGGRMHHGVRMLVTLAGPVAGVVITLVFAAKGTALIAALAPSPLARETTRVSMWSGALDIWRQFPVFGSGLGAFEDAFRSPSILRSVAHPHNEFLNVAATAGFTGVAVALVALLSTWSALVRTASGSRSTDSRSIALAAFGALCAITIHGFVDFPLAVPAIGAVLACVVGAGLGGDEG